MDRSFDLKAALASLRGIEKLLICPHDDPDPDALASAWAIEVLLRQRLGIESVIAFAGIIGRAENRAMVRELDIKLRRLEGIDLSMFDGVFLADTQPAARNHSVPAGLPFVGCVDHHGLLPNPMDMPWFDVRPDEETSASIALGYLIEENVALDPSLATAILYALKTDTSDFSRGATERDLAAYAYVFPRADHRTLGNIINPELEPRYFDMLYQVLQVAMVHEFAVIIFIPQLPYPDLVAEMADLFVRRKGITWCMCAGIYNHSLRFSLRTEDEEANAGAAAQELVMKFGGAAGGHGMTAGGRVHFPGVGASHLAETTWPELRDSFCTLVGISRTGKPLLKYP